MAPFDGESDEELVALARAGSGRDQRPFEALVRRHQGHIVTNCRVLTRSSANAEDLAQEVFVKAFFGLRRFEGRSQFRTWLQRIKVNHCLNHLRRERAGVMVDVDDLDEIGQEALRAPAAAERELEARSERERILAVLDSLPDTLRIPLMLRDGDGQSYEEIAEALGIGLSAVKMRIKRGREAFRARFTSNGAPAPVETP